MTLLQRKRSEHIKQWPDQKMAFNQCFLGRPKKDVRGSIGLHAVAGEVLMMKHGRKNNIEVTAWSTRTQVWIYLQKDEVEILDHHGELEVA